MATVRMIKGDKFADIYDSPETIRQAQIDGYTICDVPVEPKQVNEPVEVEKVETVAKPAVKRAKRK